MQKFNGKIQVGDHAETNSEMTTATRRTGKSSAINRKSVRGAPSTGFGSPSIGGDDLDDGPGDGDFDGDADQGSVMNAQDDDEEIQETAEEKMKRLAA